MTTRIEQITIHELIDAARRFGEIPATSSQLSPSYVSGWAAVIDRAAWTGKGEVVDGMHRVARLVAWADDDHERLAATVPVVVTDDEVLVRTILDRKDEGHDDVDDLIEAALA